MTDIEALSRKVAEIAGGEYWRYPPHQINKEWDGAGFWFCSICGFNESVHSAHEEGAPRPITEPEIAMRLLTNVVAQQSADGWREISGLVWGGMELYEAAATVWLRMKS